MSATTIRTSGPRLHWMTVVRTVPANGGTFYFAVIETGEGVSITIPTYVRIKSDDVGEESAVRIGWDIALWIEQNGFPGVPTLIHAGVLPFEEYVRGWLHGWQAGLPPAPCREFTSSLSPGSRRLEVAAFAGQATRPIGRTSLSVPGEYSPEFTEYVREVVGRHLAGPIRSKFKAGRNRLTDDAVMTHLPERYHVRPAGRGEYCQLWFPSVHTERGRSVSLLTADGGVAAARAEAVYGRLMAVIEAGQSVGWREVKRWVAELARAGDGANPPVLRLPADSPIAPHRIERARGGALTCQTHLGGASRLGYKLKLHVFRASDAHDMPTFTIGIGLPAGLVGTIEEAQRIQAWLHDFAGARLTAYLAAGGHFPRIEDWRTAPAGTRQTERGVGHLRRILQQRAEPGFVEGAIRAGVKNPFDADLSATRISQFVRGGYVPQPSHSQARFERVSDFTHPGGPIRFAVVVRGDDGSAVFDYPAEADDLDEMQCLADDIDRCTSSLARGNDAPRLSKGVIQQLRQVMASNPVTAPSSPRR